MNFRRLPFQFSSTDPVERQAELEKRFGLPSRNNMYVDVANPFTSMDAAKTGGSPRLQHRVPIFLEGHNQPIKTSVDSVSSTTDAGKKSNVRVIPIEIESVDSRPSSSRRRTFSGPSGMVKEKENSLPSGEEFPQLKRSLQDVTMPSKVKLASGPKVHNIPIQIEGRNAGRSPAKQENLAISKVKKDHVKTNGCVTSKQSSKSKCVEKIGKPDPVSKQKVESPIEVSLRKIEEVLKELVSYEAGVKEFTGTVKDKQYRYLDEMLTRCMLRLDDIETMGNNDIRAARKNAVKEVQACVDLLERKVNAQVGSAEKLSDGQNDSQSVDVEMNETEVPKPSKNVSPSKQTAEVQEPSPKSSNLFDSEINAAGDFKECAKEEMEENISIGINDPVLTDNNQELNIEMNETGVIQTDSNIEMSEVETVENASDKKVDVVQLPKTTEADTCMSDVLQPNVEDVDMKDVSGNQVSESDDSNLNSFENQIEVSKIDIKGDITPDNTTNELLTVQSVVNTVEPNSKDDSTEL